MVISLFLFVFIFFEIGILFLCIVRNWFCEIGWFDGVFGVVEVSCVMWFCVLNFCGIEGWCVW